MDNCAFCESCPFDMKAKGSLSIYEIHVTVETDDVDKFKRVCLANRIKPIVIKFQNYLDGSTMTQVMTSQQVEGNYFAMKQELEYITTTLKGNGFKVVREKVEAMPSMSRLMKGCYFESHLGFKVRQEDIDKLRQDCSEFGLHLSQNAFKKDGEVITMMATLREKDLNDLEFTDKVKGIQYQMIKRGYEVAKVIVEYCVIDNKEDLDREWLGV